MQHASCAVLFLERKPSTAEVGVVDGIVLQASAPVQYVAVQAAQGVRDVPLYFYLVDVKRDNDRLRLERTVLRDENLRLRGEAVENRRLRQLLQLRERVRGESLSAQVIAKEISPAFRVIQFDWIAINEMVSSRGCR